MSALGRRAFFGMTGASAIGLSSSGAAGSSPACREMGPGSRQPVIETIVGKVRGTERDGIQIFKGVPYGASTAGANRFQPPRPADPWTGIRDALAFGPQCPVTPASALDAPHIDSPEDAFLLYRNYMPHVAHEDCLRLNIWAPAGTGRRPIMVYMHGGGFVAGSGHDLLAYDGENLARRGDVVVITHNHRLNAFGFLDLSTFGGRWEQSANLGMQDIVAVLQWVQDNAARFGGDPGNVTIFGQSGGGGKVQALMAMPSARGLFHKAIIQSGVIPGFGQATRADGREMADSVLRDLGIDANSLEALASLPTDHLCRVATGAGRAFRWSPVVDGTVITDPPGSDAALAAGMPLIVGTVLNELANAVDNPAAASFDDEALRAATRKVHGKSAEAIIAAYRDSNPDRTPFELWCSIQAAGIRAAAYDLAARKHALDGKCWQYLFSWRTPMLEGRPKTFHSAEIAFVFDNAGLCVNQTGGGQAALRLAGQMSDAWIAFAHSGSPDHRQLPAWPAFDARRPVMIFDDRCRIARNPEGEGLRLIHSGKADGPR